MLIQTVQTKRFTKGDRAVPLRAKLVDGDGNIVVLTGNTVVFRMVHRTTKVVKINAVDAVVENALLGEVRYDWAAIDVNAVGKYDAWFIRTITATGLPEHFPGQGKFLVIEFVDDN